MSDIDNSHNNGNSMMQTATNVAAGGMLIVALLVPLWYFYNFVLSAWWRTLTGRWLPKLTLAYALLITIFIAIAFTFNPMKIYDAIGRGYDYCLLENYYPQLLTKYGYEKGVIAMQMIEKKKDKEELKAQKEYDQKYGNAIRAKQAKEAREEARKKKADIQQFKAQVKKEYNL